MSTTQQHVRMQRIQKIYTTFTILHEGWSGGAELYRRRQEC